MSDQSEVFRERIRQATEFKSPLRIRGGGSKDFYGQSLQGDVLDVSQHVGVINYEPSELVITARTGTPLADLERIVAAQGQMLAFEAPHFGPGATLGGCVASGLSGPRRATAGAVRDYVLGVKMLNGKGEALSFGGQVIKNVAGYDVSRLMAGALGTLGLLLEVSLKVVPRPHAETSLRLSMSFEQSIMAMNEWAGRQMPISGTCWLDGELSVRLSGAEAAVKSARSYIGGESLDQAEAFWADLREQRLPFFAGDQDLWRFSVPSKTPPLGFAGERLYEWGGALRWLRSTAEPGAMRRRAQEFGGHVTLFRGDDKSIGVFQALPSPLMLLHKRLKQSFDPNGIFNPGRLYVDF